MNVCFSSKHQEQVTVPARSTFEYGCTIELYKAGPFEAPMVIFLEDNGVREVTLTIRGVAVATEERSREQSPKP